MKDFYLTGLLKDTLPLSTKVMVRTPQASKARAMLHPSVPAPIKTIKYNITVKLVGKITK